MNHDTISEFTKELRKLATTQRISSSSRKWRIDSVIYRLIVKEFEIKAERYTNPFSRDTSIEDFYSVAAEDQQFGAKSQNTNQAWSETCIINAINIQEKEKMIRKAIISTDKKDNQHTIIITKTKDMEKIMNNMKITRTYIKTVAIWTEGIHVQSSINKNKTQKLNEQIGIFLITSHENHKVTTQFKNTFTKISKEIYGYTPDFKIKTKENSENTQQNTNKDKNKKRNNNIKLKIGTYMLTTALEALDIRNPKHMMEKIINILQQNNTQMNTNNNNSKQKRITQEDVEYAKKKLWKYVISELDKNTGQLYIS